MDLESLVASKPLSFVDYKILEKIGMGGMGTVYKAVHLKTQKIVALKTLINQHNSKNNERFILEIRAIAKLNHPGIVKLFDAGTSPCYYYTMEYIEGCTLEAAMHSLTPEQVVVIIQKIALALYHAHCRGLLHRDIKPANILLDKNLEPKITDFGLVKNIRGHDDLSQVGKIVGTPKYLSPEQIQEHPLDKRSDLFSLGVTMYEALAKEHPFSHGENQGCVNVMYKILHEEPISLSQKSTQIPLTLAKICDHCIAKDPRKRYANTRFLVRDLENFLEGKPISFENKKLFLFSMRENLNKFMLYSMLLFLPIFFLIQSITLTFTQSFFDTFDISSEDLSFYPEKGKLLLDWYVKQEKLYAMNIIELYSNRLWSQEEGDFIDEISHILTVKKQEMPDNLQLYHEELYYYIKKNYVTNKGFSEKLIYTIELINNEKFKKYIDTPLHQDLITFLEILYNTIDRKYTKRNEDIENKRIIAEKLALEYQRLLPIEINKVALQLSVWSEINEGEFEHKVKSIISNWATVDSAKILEKDSESIKHIIAQIKEITNFSEIIFAKESIWRILYLLSKLGIIKKEVTTLTLYENAFSYFYFAQEQSGDSWTKEKYFLQAINLKEQAIFYQYLAIFYAEMEMLDEVIVFSQKGLGFNPSNCTFHFYLAKSYISQGLYDKAQKHLNFIKEHYVGEYTDLIYQQQVKLYLLRGHNFLTEKELKELFIWSKENKNKNSVFYEQGQLWQKVYYEYLGQVKKAQSIFPDNEETETSKFHKMKIYHELKMFSHVYDVYDTLKNSKAYKDRAQVQKIFTQIAELESLGWQLNDNYVVELWLKTNEELTHQFNMNGSSSNIVWFRKLIYLQTKGIGHTLTDEKIVGYFKIGKLAIPNEIKNYYFYHKTMANVADINRLHQYAFENYHKTIQLAPLYEKIFFVDHRDKNLGRYFQYDHQYKELLLSSTTATLKSRQIASNILQYNPKYGGAQALLGRYYSSVQNIKKALFYFSQIEELSLPIHEKKNYHFDFAGVYFQMENYEKALYFYSKWQVYEPFHVFSYLYPGKCLQKLGRYEEAITNFNKLVAFDGSKNKFTKGYNVHSLEYRARAYEEWAESTLDKSKKREYFENAFSDWEKVQSDSFQEMFEKIEAMARITEKFVELEEERNKRQKLLERSLRYWTDLYSSWNNLVAYNQNEVQEKWLEEHKSKANMEIHRLKDKIGK